MNTNHCTFELHPFLPFRSAVVGNGLDDVPVSLDVLDRRPRRSDRESDDVFVLQRGGHRVHQSCQILDPNFPQGT